MHVQLLGRSLFGCALVFALTASLARSQPVVQPKSTLPDGLRHVPPDALAFVHYRFGDFLKTDPGHVLISALKLDREAGRALHEMEQMLGTELANIDTVTFFLLPPPTNLALQFGEIGGRWGIDRRMHEEDLRMERMMREKRMFEEKRFLEKFDEKKDAPKLEDRKCDDTNPCGASQETDFPPRHDHDIDMRQSVDYLALSGPLFVVTTNKPLDRKKIMRRDFNRTFDHRGMYDRPGRRDPSLLFLNDRSLLMGKPWEIARYSEMMARNPGPKARPLQSALALGANRHLVVAGGHLPPALRQLMQFPDRGDEGLRLLAPLMPLFHTEAGLTLDFDKSAELNLQFHAANEASSDLTLEAVKSWRVLTQLAMEKTRENGEPGGWKLRLDKAINQALADAVIEQKGLTVRAKLKLELEPAFFKSITKEFVANMRVQGDRTRSVNNLKLIGLAMHGYHDANKHLPPAGISGINDPNGKPLLSWRVAILPYIEQQPLYSQFDLTQPWDHPTNKKLIARMPEIYIAPGSEVKEGMTHYRVLVGPGTMFEVRQGAGGRQVGLRLVEITDGTSNTIMAVEAAEPTIWTRPDDLAYDPKGALPKLGLSTAGFNAVFGDGSVHYIRGTTPEEVIRAMITCNGGEAFTFPDLPPGPFKK